MWFWEFWPCWLVGFGGVCAPFEPVSDLNVLLGLHFFVAVTGGQPWSFKGVFSPFLSGLKPPNGYGYC